MLRYEAAFERFFTKYEMYERDSSEWDQLYGQRYGRSQPGWVALYGNTPVPDPEPKAASQVVDPQTGATISVIPVDDSVASTPVVQPLADDEDTQ